MWFLVIFCPPLYFFLRGRWFAGIINFCVCAVAFALIPILPVAILIGAIAVGHAAIDYGRRERTKFAKEQAREFAKELKAAQGSQGK